MFSKKSTPSLSKALNLFSQTIAECEAFCEHNKEEIKAAKAELSLKESNQSHVESVLDALSVFRIPDPKNK